MLDKGSRNMEDLASDVSLDEELGTQILKIPGVERAMKDANKKLRRSNREKNIVEIYGYDTYMAMNYAYMSKVVQIPNPNSLD